jgi:hypothetical protein
MYFISLSALCHTSPKSPSLPCGVVLITVVLYRLSLTTKIACRNHTQICKKILTGVKSVVIHHHFGFCDLFILWFTGYIQGQIFPPHSTLYLWQGLFVVGYTIAHMLNFHKAKQQGGGLCSSCPNGVTVPTWNSRSTFERVSFLCWSCWSASGRRKYFPALAGLVGLVQENIFPYWTTMPLSPQLHRLHGGPERQSL